MSKLGGVVIVFLSAAGAVATPAVDVNVAAGMFQYYDAEENSSAGPSLKAAMGVAGENAAASLDGRYRAYEDGDRAWSVEGRVVAFFHPAPVRPYCGPTVGFEHAELGYDVGAALLGGRVGGVLAADKIPVTVDLYAGYRIQAPLELAPASFYSELYAGGEAEIRLGRTVSLVGETLITRPGIFIEEHTAYGAGVMPAFTVGAAAHF